MPTLFLWKTFKTKREWKDLSKSTFDRLLLGVRISEGEHKFTRKFVPQGYVFTRKYVPGVHISKGYKFPITPACRERIKDGPPVHGLPKWITQMDYPWKSFEMWKTTVRSTPNNFSYHTFRFCFWNVPKNLVNGCCHFKMAPKVWSKTNGSHLWNVSEANLWGMVRTIMWRASNSCFSPFKWFPGVVHLSNPFR